MTKNRKSKTPPAPPADTVREVSFKTELEDRYLAYAMSTITARSLPDVRDGLKPVHRRLLYAMLQLKLDPKSGFKKCARVVGDVIGKYHPHGDVAVYDAMVRLAQDFAVRYPLVEGQGNFGSIDGDGAAAMRYTEARLTEVGLTLMDGIYENTVDFRPNYDGSDQEPELFPSAFPNLLANGSEGIAVGMATSIPPHNVGEVCDALLHLIKSPNARMATLVEHVRGPDFPTGGVIAENAETIINAYETGKGSFRVRARWEKEELSHGLYQIVVTEIPYQIQKSKLIEKLADALKDKKLPLLGNIRDESAEDIRVVLEPKSRSVDPSMLMESLFRSTDLEIRFAMNLNVITSAGVPKVLNLREVLQEFLNHRHDVLIRRSNWRLEKIDHRLEILDGLLICYLNLDEVIRIIREEEDPKAKLIKKFKLTEVQVEAILNTRLRSLRKLEEMEIKREHKELKAEKAGLKALLKDESLRWQKISEEIRDIKARFGQKTALGKRRTDFTEPPVGQVISVEAFIEKEPITIVCSRMGWLRAFKGHLEDISEIKYKEGDEERFILKAKTTDKIVFFASNGRFYTLGGDKIPGGKGHGEPIRLHFDLENEHDLVQMLVHDEKRRLLVAGESGRGFIVPEADVLASTRNGKQILNLKEGEKAVVCTPASGDHVAAIGENRKLLIFPISQMPEMKKGAGVKLQNYKDGGLSDVKCFTYKEGLTWLSGGREKREGALKPWLGNRADAGRLPPTGFPRSNKFS